MTLYDIVLTHQDTFSNEGFRSPGGKKGKRLTLTITPYEPMNVPPGSTLVVQRSNGEPEAHLTGDGVHLVRRGDSLYEQTHIIDAYTLTQVDLPSEYIAMVGEKLVHDAIRAIAAIKVVEAAEAGK